MGADGEDHLVPYYHRSPSSDLNNNILLAAIISLSIVLILVFALHLYTRCVIGRRARRAAAIEQLSLTVAHAHHSMEPLNAGLDPTAIASLPMFIFKRTESKKKKRDDDDATTMECVVCLML